MTDDEEIKNYATNIEYHLNIALAIAQQMQAKVSATEGDSDLYRKLACYLTPGLIHWTTGAQAGNMKDLNELFARRLALRETKMVQAQTRSGHDVLTKPSK